MSNTKSIYLPILCNQPISQQRPMGFYLVARNISRFPSDFISEVPIFMLRGNHETRGKFADNLQRYFPTPSGKFYQLRNFFGVDFLFVDSGEDKPDSDIEYSDIADYDNYRVEQAKWKTIETSNIIVREYNYQQSTL